MDWTKIGPWLPLRLEIGQMLKQLLDGDLILLLALFLVMLNFCATKSWIWARHVEKRGFLLVFNIP